MMRSVLQALLAVTLLCGVTACGTKGKLKTPSQIEADEAKKARKAQKKEARKAPAEAVEEVPAEGEK